MKLSVPKVSLFFSIHIMVIPLYLHLAVNAKPPPHQRRRRRCPNSNLTSLQNYLVVSLHLLAAPRLKVLNNLSVTSLLL